MVAEGHAQNGNLNKHKSLSASTSTSTSNLNGKATSGSNGNFGLSTREKYLSLQKRFEELTAIQTQNKAILENASSKLKSLQDECDMLIDSIAPHVSAQPSLLHYLERMSREGANLGPGGGHSHGSDSSLRAADSGASGARGSGGR